MEKKSLFGIFNKSINHYQKIMRFINLSIKNHAINKNYFLKHYKLLQLTMSKK